MMAGFDTPEQAAGLFKQILPPTITEMLAWETLARESGSFIDPELRNRQSDPLFSVQLAHGGGAVLLYLLLEHQSSNDMVRIWKRYRKKHKGLQEIVWG
jgi:predicted transposase YdaD